MAAADPPDTRRALDEAAVARIVRRLGSAGEPPWLHREIARRLGERLGLVRRQPKTVLQWAGWLGAGGEALRAAYPSARLLAVEPAPMPPRARPWWKRGSAPLADEGAWPQADLLWSNMALHAVRDPAALLVRWRKTLAPDGFLMCSTLGPGSLVELRALYRELGFGAPAADFVDMHDLGDMLVQAGFAGPVMDQEPLRLTWATPEAALAELRALGGNADPGRFAGLRTPRWRQRLLAALAERAGADGRVGLDLEIVYGHAFNAPPRATVAAHTEVSLEDFRAMARARRGASP
jgi:malonyl-CoA O-methyltransferase